MSQLTDSSIKYYSVVILVLATQDGGPIRLRRAGNSSFKIQQTTAKHGSALYATKDPFTLLDFAENLTK